MSAAEAPDRDAAAALDARRDAIAAALVARQFAAMPELERRYGAIGREKCLQDAGYHLAYLAEAVGNGDAALFADYIAWAKVMLARRGVPAADLARQLEFMGEALGEALPAAQAAPAQRLIDHALRRLPAMPETLASLIEPGQPQSLLAQQYLQALLAGERQRASRLILDAAERGVPVKELYLGVFQRTQREIGRLWQENQIMVAQEHYCTAATQLIMSQLYPRIFSGEKTHGAFVATCVSGDLHEIGVRMVADFFEMEGWDTFYLGANTPAAQILRAVRDRNAHLLAVSVTLTQHLSAAAGIVRELRADERTCAVRLLVGGGPFNTVPDLWKAFGADAYAGDAASAVETADRLFDLRAAGHGYG